MLNRNGIKTESEVFSGCHFSGIGFEQNEDDQKNTTTAMTLRTATELFKIAREDFFNVGISFWLFCVQQFHENGYMAITSSQGNYDDPNVLRRAAKYPTAEMRQMAVIYYIVAYGKGSIIS